MNIIRSLSRRKCARHPCPVGTHNTGWVTCHYLQSQYFLDTKTKLFFKKIKLLINFKSYTHLCLHQGLRNQSESYTSTVKFKIEDTKPKVNTKTMYPTNIHQRRCLQRRKLPSKPPKATPWPELDETLPQTEKFFNEFCQ